MRNIPSAVQGSGLTQAKVARQPDVPRSFVNKYESGARRPDVIELPQLIDALDVRRGAVLERLDPSWLTTESSGASVIC